MTERETAKLFNNVHRQKHRASGGYVNRQRVVLLLLLIQSVSIPVGFGFLVIDECQFC